MTSIIEFFLMEARESLDGMARVLDAADADRVDAEELHRLARALRGSAQLARQDRIREVAGELEGGARALTQGRQQWNERMQGRVRDAIRELRSLVDRVEPDDAESMEMEPGGPVVVEQGVDGEPDARQPESEERTLSDAQGDITAVVEQAEQLASELSMLPDPGERIEEMVELLSRVRDDASDAGLAEAAALAERALARLRIGGTAAVLALMPRLRDVIREGDATPAAPDPAGEPTAGVAGAPDSSAGAGPATPQPDEAPELAGAEPDLTADREAVPEPSEPAGAQPDAAPAGDETPGASELPQGPDAVPAGPETAALAGVGDDAGAADMAVNDAAGAADEGAVPGPDAGDPEAAEVVPIEELCYRGEGALKRALELRTELEGGAELPADARAALEEVFDLIRLGMR